MDKYTQDYYNALVNAPPPYTGVPVYEFTRKPSYIPGKDKFDKTPFIIIPDVKPGEIFLQITQSELLPNIFPGRYYISNYGRVYDAFQEKFLDGALNSGGALNVKLCTIEGNTIIGSKTIYIHQIVNYYFNYLNIALRKEYGYIVNHKDGDLLNNYADNLEWISRKDLDNKRKMQDYQNQLNRLMKDQGEITVSLSVNIVRQICELLSIGYSNKYISLFMNIDDKTISAIRCRKRYSVISKDYVFNDNNSMKAEEETILNNVNSVCKLLSQGVSIYGIVNILKLDKQFVLDIKNKKIFMSIKQTYGLQ